MIRVTVILPDKRKGEIEIDPNARLIDVKNALVNDLSSLTNASEEYILAVIDRDQKSSIGKIEIQEGDSLMLLDISETKSRPIPKTSDDNFS